jgi:DNA processing protein
VFVPQRLKATDAAFPERLRALYRWGEIWVAGRVDSRAYVGIVGTREAHPWAMELARGLAAEVCRANACVVSGGAPGIDRAAHEGALEAGGHTIAVLGTGAEHPFPSTHAPLYERIVEDKGGLIWGVPPNARYRHGCFNRRNELLVALCDALVVVQAPVPVVDPDDKSKRKKSGALHAAVVARRFGRPLWGVPVSPADRLDRDALQRFEGMLGWLRAGKARPLFAFHELIDGLGRPATAQLTLTIDPEEALLDLTEEEKTLWGVVDETPRHLDDLAARAGLGPQAIQTALLTLALENVVVEGPGGFFRRP